MTRIAIFSLALVAILAAGGCRHEPPPVAPDAGGQAQAAAGTTAVACDKPEHDFGTVKQGQSVRHSFRLRNTGTATLVIDRVQAGCSCTAAVVSQREIPPGAEGEIEVRLNTRGRKGELVKGVTVFTNAPLQAELKLSLRGTIEILADFDRPRLYLREVLKGTTRTEVVGLEGSQLAKLKPDPPISSAPGRLSGTWIEQDEKRALQVTFIAGPKEERFSGRLTAITGLAEPEQLKLTVNALVTGDLVTDRSHLTFAPYREGHEPAYVVSLRSLAGKAFEVKAIEDSSGAVSGQAERTEAGWQVSLRLTKTPAQPRGRIAIKTDRRDQATLELSYLVRDGSQARPADARVRLKNLKEPERPSLKLDRPIKPGAPRTGVRLRPLAPRGPVRVKKAQPDAPLPYPPPSAQSVQPTP